MLYLIIGLTVVFFLIYFILMIVTPEWVGISGENTKKDLEAHKDTRQETDKEVKATAKNSNLPKDADES